jgi:peptidoglycan-N-acetylglucosamine deacetylase
MRVSLTFDSDGGDVGHAIAYLDILHARGIHATFFLTGDFAAAHPDVVRRILADGNELGNHTVDHPNLISPPRSDSFICSELARADQEIIAAGGHTSRPFFRPPGGNYNDQVRYLAAGLGYRTVYWSIDPRDWDPTVTAEDILDRVLNGPGLKPGAIILMHVNSPNEQYALDGVITGLEDRGYSIVPLSQLLG